MDRYQTLIPRQSFIFRGHTYTAEMIQNGQFRKELAGTAGAQVEGTENLPDRLGEFLEEWFSSEPTVQVQTSGSTGIPKRMQVRKENMVQSALATCRYFHFQQGQKVLLCMNLKFIGAKMMVVRALVAGMELVVPKVLSGRPFKGLDEDIDFAPIVPLQLFNTLESDPEAFRHLKTLLVGGGAVDEQLLERIQDLPTQIYSSYGMTETLSHIALRKLNGPDRSRYYQPLEGVELSLQEDGRLTIKAPLITRETLITNDLASLEPDGRFLIRGRADNVITSGGIKIQIEKVEGQLRQLLEVPFALTAVRDEKFGEKAILLIQQQPDRKRLETLKKKIGQTLEKYDRPKGFLFVEQIPMTENGKIKRLACRELAEQDKNLIFV